MVLLLSYVSRTRGREHDRADCGIPFQDTRWFVPPPCWPHIHRRVLKLGFNVRLSYLQRPLRRSAKLLPAKKPRKAAAGANTAKCSNSRLCTLWRSSRSSTLVWRSRSEVRCMGARLSVRRTHLLIVLGWIVTYVIELRGGGPSSGYISSGFFGGTRTFTHIKPLNPCNPLLRFGSRSRWTPVGQPESASPCHVVVMLPSNCSSPVARRSANAAPSSSML